MVFYGRRLTEAIEVLKQSKISIMLANKGPLIYYRRTGGFPEGPVEKALGLSSLDDLVICPVHSVQPEVSTYLLLRLRTPFIIPPRSTATIYLKAPVAAGVYVTANGEQRLVDYFGPSVFKYALYGPQAVGQVCRFYITDIFSEVPEAGPWEAVTKVVVENTSDNYVEIRNVIYPIVYAQFYIDNMGNAYLETSKLSITSSNVGVVELRNEPPISGLPTCLKTEGGLPLPFLKPAGEKIAKFLMEFGL